MFKRRNLWVGAVAVTALSLTACGGGDDASDDSAKAAETTDSTTAPSASDSGSTESSELSIAADAIITVQSEKYEDYEIDGDTVRLAVRDGVDLNGSECMIIESATGADHPEAQFVLVEADGNETVC